MLRGTGIIDRYFVKQLSGKSSISSRKKLNRFGGFPNVSYEGELHPISLAYSKDRKMILPASNSYLGPNTNVERRLLDKTPALPGINGSRDSPDKGGEAHDLRFLVAENTDDLRRADEKFKSKMREFSKTKEKYNPSTWIGLRGIELKNQLEDSGRLSKETFLNPTKDPKIKQLALSRLKELEQEGYGKGFKLPTIKSGKRFLSKMGKRVTKEVLIPYMKMINPYDDITEKDIKKVRRIFSKVVHGKGFQRRCPLAQHRISFDIAKKMIPIMHGRGVLFDIAALPFRILVKMIMKALKNHSAEINNRMIGLGKKRKYIMDPVIMDKYAKRYIKSFQS